MTFERIYDAAIIKEVITHPKLYRMLGDDFSPAPEAFQPVVNEHVWYVLAKSGLKVDGLFIFHPHTAVCWEVHTCLLPHVWGKSGETARALIQWTWENTPCLRIVTSVPEYNRLAWRLAKQAGLKAYGRNPKAIQRHQKLHDVLLLGISK